MLFIDFPLRICLYMESLNLSCSMNIEPDITPKMIKMKLFSFKDKLENGSRLLDYDFNHAMKKTAIKKLCLKGKVTGI